MRSARPFTGYLPVPQKPKLPLRARRRRVRIYLVLAALIFVAVLAWTISWVSYLPRFNIRNVSVSGTNAVPPNLIEAFVERELSPDSHPYLSPDNIFLFNTGRLSRDIAGFFPLVKSASVSRPSLFSTTLKVAIVERQPFALWCASAESDCYQMDDSGFIFAQAPQDATTTISAATSYIFYGGLATSSIPIGSVFAPAHLPGIVALLQMLSQANFAPQGATVEDDQDFSIPLQQGFYIKASFGEDAEALVNNLQLVLASDALVGKEGELEYVDLRFGDKVYFKLNGQTQTSTSSLAH